MDKLECPCGFSHDLSSIPDEGWVTVRDEDYQRLLRVEIQRASLSAAVAETPDWEALVAADAELETLHGVLYQCPRCGRILWKKPGDSGFKVFAPENGPTTKKP